MESDPNSRFDRLLEEMAPPGARTMSIDRDIIKVSDVRETIFGPVDFGYIILGPERHVWSQ